MNANNPPVLTKDLLLIVPLLGSAIAITFDLGYFGGIDINLFTIFSISEHITFALEALPFAVLVAGTIALFVAYQRNAQDQLKSMKARSAKSKSAINVGLGLFVASGVIYGTLYGRWVFIFTGIAAGLIIGWVEKFQPNVAKVALWVSLSVLVCTFAIGFQAARDYLDDPNAPLTVQTVDGSINGKLIRSGDRGILIYEAQTKRIILVRWDAIRQLSEAR